MFDLGTIGAGGAGAGYFDSTCKNTLGNGWYSWYHVTPSSWQLLARGLGWYHALPRS